MLFLVIHPQDFLLLVIVVLSYMFKLPVSYRPKLKDWASYQERDNYLGPIINTLRQVDSNYLFIISKKSRGGTDAHFVSKCFVDECIKVHQETLGRLGVFKTWSALKNDFCWKGVFRDVKRVLKGCGLCQKSKEATFPKPPLGSVMADSLNEIISLVFYGPLP